jgi:hypothetical protein
VALEVVLATTEPATEPEASVLPDHRVKDTTEGLERYLAVLNAREAAEAEPGPPGKIA